MILSDKSINEAIASGRLEIDPFDPRLVQPSSIDVRLDHKFLIFRNTKRAYIDVKQPAEDLMEMIEVGPDEPMFLHPHEFVLGSTVERVRMPDDLVARLEGRSSLGRLGVVIHSTAGFIDPAFEGHVTLEISNLANLPIALYAGMRIGQLSFSAMTTPAERPYGAARGSKYSGQNVPTASRLYLDFLQQQHG
ncbi:MAG: dCTP deaminase [Chloroflexi bacterium]|nr:dCTP deaminase [Chloroflexota bacterium]